MELRFLERTRFEVIAFLRDKSADGDELIYNLSLSDLGLNSAIHIIAETVEKRVALGSTEDAAIDAALAMFQSFLESGEEGKETVFDFARFMAETCLPAIERPDGTFIHNPNAI